MQINVNLNSKAQAAMISALSFLVAFICAVSFDKNRSNDAINVFVILVGILSMINAALCGGYAVVGYIDDMEREERNGRK